MITKAIVDDVSDKYEIKVRIPMLDRSSLDPRYVADAYLPSAPICTLPNTGLNLRKGDVVWVAFENGDPSRPVIVGCLYTDKVSETEASTVLNSLSVSAYAELPKNTKIGDVSSKELEYLKGLSSNVQAQIDEINNVIGGDVADVPVVRSNGMDSVVQKTSDSERVNVASGPYSFSFGSRNSISSDASESGAFGGLVSVTSPNTYGFGYRVFGHGNQSIVGGYHTGSNAQESLVFGNNVVVDCYAQTIPGDSNPDHYPLLPNSTAYGNKSKYLMVFGEGISVSSDCQSDLIYGKGHVIPRYVYNSTIGGDEIVVNGALSNSVVFGQKHRVGLNGTNWVNTFGYNNRIGVDNPLDSSSSSFTYSGGNEDVNVFGYQNSVGSYLKDSTIVGYYNKVVGGTGSGDGMKESVYILGHDNHSYFGTTSNPSGVENVYIYGRGLHAKKSMIVIVGSYNRNEHRDDTYFEVGTGSPSSRRTSFSVCYNSSNGHHIYIGDEILTKAQLQALKALIS